MSKRGKQGARTTNWDSVAHWYNGWVGKRGSDHHRKLAIPALMELLQPEVNEQILDVGCGQGVLSPFIVRAGAQYTGVDASSRLIGLARRHHKALGRFVQGDACKLGSLSVLGRGRFDAAVFLLSIQNMGTLEDIFQSVDRVLKVGGRIVLLMTHPCFRLPRQSGWGWDRRRQLRYRRVDRYLTPFHMTEKIDTGRKHGKTVSFHRPLEAYINGLSALGLLVDRVQEIPTFVTKSVGPWHKAEDRANREIPLFLGIRARNWIDRAERGR